MSLLAKIIGIILIGLAVLNLVGYLLFASPDNFADEIGFILGQSGFLLIIGYYVGFAYGKPKKALTRKEDPDDVKPQFA